ncbi:MAG: acyltransferase family protein [Planctomycetota bacterium]|nr:acyltransferase family protein [Planctomycetota bacterium]
MSLKQAEHDPRFHALDGLRATMMLLGLVLHSACNYQNSPPDIVWNFRDTQTSGIFSLLVLFIHAWRMPIFMILAGFFSALLVERRGTERFLSHRMSRLALPLLLFLPVILPLTTSGFAFASAAMGKLSFGESSRLSSTPHWGDLFPPITIHMWFIYYLVLYCLLAFLWIHGSRILLPKMMRHLPRRCVERVMRWPGGTLLLSIPLILILKDSAGLLNTGVQFIPETTSFIAYGFLYLCGWALWNQRDLLDRLRHWPSTILSLGFLLVLFPVWLQFFLCWIGLPPGDLIEGLEQLAGVEEFQRSTISLIGATLSTLMIWNAIWGFLGFFMLTTDRDLPLLRYIVDGSYWVYLVHLPFCIWIPALMFDLDFGAAGAFWKFFITLLSTTLIGFVSYEWCVRNGPIGELLNGRRWPRTLASALRNRPLVEDKNHFIG